MMAFDFSVKRILVTGVTKGIGREVTKALVKRGAEVYGFGRNQVELASLAEECGSMLHVKQLDVSDWETTRAELQKLPPMHGLVNNAGTRSPVALALDVTKESMEKVFAVNVMASLNVTQVVGKKMVEEGIAGSIVNVSSMVGVKPHSRMLPYSVSKAALDMMTQQLALELGPSNIRVNSVNPAIVKTKMTEQYFTSGAIDRIVKITPLRRYLTMADIVQPILYLLSDSSAMVSGTSHLVDGGLLSGFKF